MTKAEKKKFEGHFYTYEDWTIEETPRCFYVCKGNISRINDFNPRRRNKRHRGIALKYGLTRKIVLDTLIEKESFTKEIELIAERKTYIYDEGSWGANFTRGGDGTVGHKHIVTDKVRKKISHGNRGKVRTLEMSQ